MNDKFGTTLVRFWRFAACLAIVVSVYLQLSEHSAYWNAQQKEEYYKDKIDRLRAELHARGRYHLVKTIVLYGPGMEFREYSTEWVRFLRTYSMTSFPPITEGGIRRFRLTAVTSDNMDETGHTIIEFNNHVGVNNINFAKFNVPAVGKGFFLTSNKQYWNWIEFKGRHSRMIDLRIRLNQEGRTGRLYYLALDIIDEFPDI